MTTVRSEPHFDFSSVEYADLYAASNATLFQHPVWLDHLYSVLAPTAGAEPLVVTGRTAASGKLQFVLPLVRRHRHVRRVEFADLGVSDYAAPVVHPSALDLLTDDRTSVAVRAAIGGADLVRIDKVADDSSAAAGLLGSRDVRAHEYETHRIALDGTFDTWKESLPSSFARHLKGKRKRLGAAGRVVEVREVDTVPAVDEAFDRMRDFRRARFSNRRAIDLVQDERYFAFYRAVARHGATHGGPGSTTVLTVNGEIVAASFSLQDEVADLFLLIGYDIERWRNYALGLLLVEDLIAASFANGKRVHDLTLGHDHYKKSFGAQPAPMHSVRVPLNLRGRVAQLAADQEASARRTAKRVLAYREQRKRR